MACRKDGLDDAAENVQQQRVSPYVQIVEYNGRARFRVQAKSCDLTKIKKSLYIIKGDDEEKYRSACAIRATLIRGDNRENGYFIVTYDDSLPQITDVRHYNWTNLQRNDVSTWNQVSLPKSEPKTARGICLLPVNNQDEPFLDVRSELNTDYDIELTAYFVWKGKLKKLHFYREGDVFIPDEKEKTNINKKLAKNSVLVKPVGAPVINHNDQVVGVLNNNLNIRYFYVEETSL